MVEYNLYLHLTTKFQEFLDIILKLSQMEAQIHTAINSIKFFRNMNRDLKAKCSEEVKQVLAMRKRKANLQQTFELVK